MHISEHLRDALIARGQSGKEILKKLQAAKPEHKLKWIALSAAPQFMNAAPPLEYRQRVARVHDVLWAAGEIAGRGQNEHGGPLVYNRIGNGPDIFIQEGRADAIVELLEKLLEHYLLDVTLQDGSCMRGSAASKTARPHGR